MCGIVGYTGNSNSLPILIEGLEKLEYRGYDSSGIGIFDKDGYRIIKEIGKIENLKERISRDKNIKGTLGIAHTRWATHGKPSINNAHPHESNRFVLVHNGIIDNSDKIKKYYLSGESFYSDTDSEVIIKLFDKVYSEKKDIHLAIQYLINLLEGSYAILIVDKESPDTIYAIKNKSPLIIGSGNGFNMIASDQLAMLSYTRTFYEIKDLEYALITKDSIDIYKKNSLRVTRTPFYSKEDNFDAEKGEYPHFMLKEIEEQPFVIRKIIKNYSCWQNGMNHEIINDFKDCDKIYIIGCGTSYHAGLVGKQLLEKIANIPTEVHIASEFIYNMPILSKKPMFIFLSQSGETADSRSVLVTIKNMGYKALTITNVNSSTLSRESDHTMLLYAGPEIAVASTKAYTAQIAVLSILAAKIPENCDFDVFSELSRVSDVIEKLCRKKDIYQKLANEYLKDSKNCFYIGRGIDYYVCMEASLKLKEISYIYTEGFAAGELKHGTIALIENNTPVIAIISDENTHHLTRNNIEEVKSRGARVITISERAHSNEGDSIVIDNVSSLLTPLVTIIPAQYLSYYTALIKNCDIDRPRNLAKSVTVE